jgi:colicin import membrane protein
MTTRPRRTTTLVGPNRIVVGAAMAGLVALASAGTALLVLTGTSAVSPVAAPAPPLPSSTPLSRAPGVIVLPTHGPGATRPAPRAEERPAPQVTTAPDVPPPALAFSDVPSVDLPAVPSLPVGEPVPDVDGEVAHPSCGNPTQGNAEHAAEQAAKKAKKDAEKAAEKAAKPGAKHSDKAAAEQAKHAAKAAEKAAKKAAEQAKKAAKKAAEQAKKAAKKDAKQAKQAEKAEKKAAKQDAQRAKQSKPDKETAGSAHAAPCGTS